MAENILDKNSEKPRSVVLVLVKLFFSFLVIASVGSVLFFTSQLTNKLDGITSNFNLANISNELAIHNDQILDNQTEINFYRYLKIKGYFDNFSYFGDFYIQSYEVLNSQTASENEKYEARMSLENLKRNLRDYFLKLNEEYKNPFIINLVVKEETGSLDIMFKDALVDLLNEKALSIKNNTDPQAKRDYKNYLDTRVLAGNNALKNLILNTDFDTLDSLGLYSFIKNINSLVVNDLSTMQEIKDQRIKWSDIIDEIELRTKQIDNYYTQDYYDDLGGIRYTNYEFDKKDRSISIVGETKRIDTKNFTVIANLIDELNSSDFFENAEMRSFNKSGDLDEGYTANLKLNLDLQEGFSTNDMALDIAEEPKLLNK